MRIFNYQLTLNNSDEESREQLLKELQEYAQKEIVLAYYFGPTEEAPTTGMKHNHVYVCFDEEKTIKQVKKCFSNQTIHIEACKGNHEENLNYASKTGEFLEVFKNESKELHENPERKRRNNSDDFTNFIHDCKMELSEEELIEKYPNLYVQYHSAFIDIMKRYRKHNLQELKLDHWERAKNYILYGSGIWGKLQEVTQQWNEEESELAQAIRELQGKS